MQKLGYVEGSAPENNVISFIQQHARKSPEKTAFYTLDKTCKAHRTLTYGQLWQQIQSTAVGLSRLGIQPGDRVLIFIPMSPALYIAMFAVQQVGAIAVFLDSWARSDQLGMCADQAKPLVFIAPEKAFEYTASLPQLDCIQHKIVVGPHSGTYDARLEDLARGNHSQPITPVEQESTALITFTTGSSGSPKGANRTHRFLCAQHYALEVCLPYVDNDIDLPVFPIFSLNNLAGGVSTVLPAIDLANAQPDDGGILIEQIQALQVTCCTLSPSLLRKVAHSAIAQGITLDSLRRVATGGAPINSNDVAEFKQAAPNAELHILYGSTEVEPIAHLITTDMPSESGQEGVCVGSIAHGLDYKLLKLDKNPIKLDKNGWLAWEVSAGDVGELVVSGEHVCQDYYNNPQAFEKSKILDHQGVVWHRTGDLCKMDGQNRLWVVGRLHNAILRDGLYLFPVKPEVVMNRLPFVKTSAYLGIPDKKLGESAIAVFCLNRPMNERDAIVSVTQALATENIPVDKVLIVRDIPLDPRHHSKVEYATLRDMILASSGSSNG